MKPKPILHLLSAALLLPFSAHADTTVSTDTTQNGGTFSVNPPILWIDHYLNDPTLTLANGASASFEGATVIGNWNTHSGNLKILGGSTLTNGGSWSNLGGYGSAFVYRGYGYIGLNAGSTGTALVSGSGSQWINTGVLSVGEYGTGALLVEAGGSVSNAEGVIGRFNGSQGAVTVTGEGSIWTNSSHLILGGSSLTTQTTGTGELTIEDGGTVWVGGTLRIFDGDTVTLDGGTIRFNGYNRNAAGTFDYQSGTVQLAGNRVAETDAAIADLYGANPVVGAGKGLVIEGSLSVGNSSAVTLTIEDGGIVAVEGGTGVYGEGTLLIRENGVLETSVLISHGEVVIEGGGAVTAGVGTQVYGGTFHIAGGGTLETQTLISNGELLVSGSLSAENGVSVNAGGILGGGGILDGDLSLAADAKFQFTLGQPLTVTGLVSLDSSFGIDDILGLDGSLANGAYVLIDGTSTDFSALGLQNWGIENAYDLGGGKSAYFSQGSLQVNVVPEPGTCLLAGAGLVALLLRRRRNI